MMPVRTLFAKIYLWFWLAMLLVLSVISLAVMRHEAGIRLSDLHQLAENSIAVTGNTVVNNFEEHGKSSLDAVVAASAKELSVIYLFKDGRELTGQTCPPAAHRIAEKVAQIGKPKVFTEDGKVFIASLVMGKQQSYVIVQQIYRKKLSAKMDGLIGFVAFKVLGILAMSALVCYLLSRYLTNPIRRISNATRRLANGELSVRVRPEVGRRRDELAELAADFDAMAERIEELVSSQKQLIGDISHELRSPLARLNFALELTRQQAGEGAQRHLDRIELEAERLNELIGHLLTLSRLETGVAVIERVPVDFALLVRKVCSDANFEAKSRGGAVDIITPETALISGIPELLHRAVENLVRNAVRYTLNGTKVEIKLSLNKASATTLLVVRDHGPGVPESALDKIFKPFFRLDDARDRQSGGTGLGLAITERAVRLHGGTVKAYNATDGGLVVEMELSTLISSGEVPEKF